MIIKVIRASADVNKLLRQTAQRACVVHPEFPSTMLVQTLCLDDEKIRNKKHMYISMKKKKVDSPQ